MRTHEHSTKPTRRGPAPLRSGSLQARRELTRKGTDGTRWLAALRTLLIACGALFALFGSSYGKDAPPAIVEAPIDAVSEVAFVAPPVDELVVDLSLEAEPVGFPGFDEVVTRAGGYFACPTRKTLEKLNRAAVERDWSAMLLCARRGCGRLPGGVRARVLDARSFASDTQIELYGDRSSGRILWTIPAALEWSLAEPDEPRRDT